MLLALGITLAALAVIGAIVLAYAPREEADDENTGDAS